MSNLEGQPIFKNKDKSKNRCKENSSVTGLDLIKNSHFESFNEQIKARKSIG